MALYIELRCDADGCANVISVTAEADIGGVAMWDAGDRSFLVETRWLPWPDGWFGEDDGGPGRTLCPAHAGAPAAHGCEAELKARANYSPFRETPPVFVCSCGKVYGVVSDEAEGVSWQLLETIHGDGQALGKPPCVLPRGCRSEDPSLLVGESGRRCGAPAVLVAKSPGGTETFLCERGHRVAIGK